MKNIKIVVAGALALVAFNPLIPIFSQASASPDKPILIAAKTEAFKEKAGFDRKKKDIINTLRDNDVAQFTTFLDGLSMAFDLDHTLKGNGPFTVFAPSDKAFKKLPADDKGTLWANKKKLKQVLQYHCVFGQIPSSALRTKTSLKTLEGGSIALSTKGDDIYADKALVTVTDIPCSNGVIHVVDEIIMPTLKK